MDEAGGMRQLDGQAPQDELVHHGGLVVRREQDQRRPQTLTGAVQDVARSLLDQVHLRIDNRLEALLDHAQVAPDFRREFEGGQRL